MAYDSTEITCKHTFMQLIYFYACATQLGISQKKSTQRRKKKIYIGGA